jgi:hypothetical protein
MSFLAKLPSFDRLVSGAVDSLKRFPLPLLSAALATVAAMIVIDSDHAETEHFLHRLIMTGSLGVPLLFALAVCGERRWGRTFLAWVPSLVGVVLLVWYFFSLPADLEPQQQHMIRYAILVAGAHFLVACLPYLSRDGASDFWHYNKSLFLRFLLAALYSAVLYIGLTIALAAADHLFGMDVKPERYMQLWVLMAGLANTWIFLAGVPEKLTNMGTVEDYPKGLAVFAQYVLLPLVALYFVILIAYEGKIIVEWNWPRGWVSQLVLWYAVVGILSLLLLHPLREKADKRWVQVFSRWFFRALIPLIVMLFLAIYIRIAEYGWTEPRYLVVAMAVGLAVVLLYFLFSKAKDIRLIPLVLAVIALVSAFGPWGAFAVSRSDQQDRLQTLLVENELYADGALIEATAEPSFDARKEMSSVVSYLLANHGVGTFDQWLSAEALGPIADSASYKRDEMLTDAFGFRYVSEWQTPDEREYVTLTASRDVLDIEGFTYLVDFETMDCGSPERTFMLGAETFGLTLDCESGNFEVRRVRDVVGDDTAFSLPLEELASQLADEYVSDQVPQGMLEFPVSLDGTEGRLVFNSVSGTRIPDGFELIGVSGWLLIK